MIRPQENCLKDHDDFVTAILMVCATDGMFEILTEHLYIYYMIIVCSSLGWTVSCLLNYCNPVSTLNEVFANLARTYVCGLKVDQTWVSQSTNCA